MTALRSDGHGFELVGMVGGNTCAREWPVVSPLTSFGSGAGWGVDDSGRAYWESYEAVPGSPWPFEHRLVWRQFPTSIGAIATIAGDRPLCVLLTDGTVRCWSEFVDALDVSSPYEEPFAEDVSVLAEGHWGQVFALSVDGTLLSYDTSPNPSVTPAPVGTQFVRLSGGEDYFCAIRPDHTLSCWGFMDRFDYVEYGHFRPVPTPQGYFVDVNMGGLLNCARRLDDSYYCWSVDDDGLIWHPPEYDAADAALTQLVADLEAGVPMEEMRECE